MLDIFNDDAFSLVALTETMNLLPYVPKRVGQMGLFETKNPRAHVIFLERRGDIISLIESKPRGSGETTKKATRQRDLRPFMIPHLPLDDAVKADDVSGIREFGTEDQLEIASAAVNDKLQGLRNDHEATHEYHRVGAIKGVILDADAAASELLDLFDAFDITQETFSFALTEDENAIKRTCVDIISYMEDRLQATTYDHIHALVGNEFFQDLVNAPGVSEAYAAQLASNPGPRWLLEQQGTGTAGRGTSQVTFGDITFENYRGKIGDRAFIEPTHAHFFPVGVPGLFQQHFGPANTMSDVNTAGKDIYVMQEPMKWDEGIELHSESNPLMICKRPSLLVKGFAGADS
jgi:hypothetical protein